jgi:hypothetical protein
MSWSTVQRRAAWYVAIGLLVAFSGGRALADLPAPGSNPPRRSAPVSRSANRTQANGQTVPFVVRFDRRQEYSRIVIPRKYLRTVAPAGAQSEAVSQTWQRRSIFAGTMLSAVIAGGFLAVVFVRRGKIGVGAATSAGIVAVLVILGSTALANMAVPSKGDSPPPVVQAIAGRTSQIVVETTDVGDQVVLILGGTAGYGQPAAAQPDPGSRTSHE